MAGFHPIPELSKPSRRAALAELSKSSLRVALAKFSKRYYESLWRSFQSVIASRFGEVFKASLRAKRSNPPVNCTADFSINISTQGLFIKIFLSPLGLIC
jgi:hypothetical protein